MFSPGTGVQPLEILRTSPTGLGSHLAPVCEGRHSLSLRKGRLQMGRVFWPEHQRWMFVFRSKKVKVWFLPESNSEKREVYSRLNRLTRVTDQERFLPTSSQATAQGETPERQLLVEKLLQSQRSDSVREVSEVQGQETRAESGRVAEADLVH